MSTEQSPLIANRPLPLSESGIPKSFHSNSSSSFSLSRIISLPFFFALFLFLFSYCFYSFSPNESNPTQNQPQPVNEPVIPSNSLLPLSFPDSTSVGSEFNISSSLSGNSSVLLGKSCEGPFPGYPYCDEKVSQLAADFKSREDFYRSLGVDGSKCSFLTYLNLNGFYCPEAADYNREPIRGVNLGGWLVLEPWITPSLFSPYMNVNMSGGVLLQDQWSFCEFLGRAECSRVLESHWNSFLVESEIKELADGGINHVRIPVGYWIMGDIRAGEPWVTGDLKYLERAIGWCERYKIHVLLDLHCAPGSQNGFDNSGHKGPIHFDDSVKLPNGRIIYPNINRALQVLDSLTAHFSQEQFQGVVVAVELVNEAFITIPIEIVKDYYLQGYEIVKKYGDLAVVIGDSFRFGSWDDFMFPPHYRHVWIDTHIYQVFDMFRLAMNWDQHIEQTCSVNKPAVAVAPLSTMVGEWSLATTDCAVWLNGFSTGARYDGSYPGSYPLGSCDGVRHPVFTPEYRQFLQEFAEKQMDAYESGSSAGWFFWNFKTENSAEWNYLLGLREGWITKDHSNRKYRCEENEKIETKKTNKQQRGGNGNGNGGGN